MKDRHLRARLPEAEYLDLKIAADRLGLTISEHVRNVLLRDRQALSQEQFLARIDVKLAGISQAAPTQNPGQNLEPLLMELLLLSREIAADRNAQILARVAHQINALYPERKKP